MQIHSTTDNTYSIEVAKISRGDTVEWSAKNEEHHVEYLEDPDFNSLPEKSDLKGFIRSLLIWMESIYINVHHMVNGNDGSCYSG